MVGHKTYITKGARDYVVYAKQHLLQLLSDKGLDENALSRRTGIPLTTLKRWLNPDNDVFMPLTAAVVIAGELDLAVCQILPPIGNPYHPVERQDAMAALANVPIEHVRALVDIYKRMLRVFKG